MPAKLEILPKTFRLIIEHYIIQKAIGDGLFARVKHFARQAFGPDPRTEYGDVF